MSLKLTEKPHKSPLTRKLVTQFEDDRTRYPAGHRVGLADRLAACANLLIVRRTGIRYQVFSGAFSEVEWPLPGSWNSGSGSIAEFA